MTLKKPIKILVGLGTLWICLYPILFLTMWFFTVIWTGLSMSDSYSDPSLFVIPFFVIAPLHCITILVQFVMIAFYLIHVIKNSTASETLRIILGIGCFFLPFIAMPTYYLVYIWPESPPTWALQSQTTRSA